MISLILVLNMVLLAQGSSLGRIESNAVDLAEEWNNGPSLEVIEADEMSLGLAERNEDSRIIGGEDAISRVIYQVSLRYVPNNYQHFCGGSIINKKWILTAGHCLSGFKPKQLVAVVGSNERSTGGVRYGCAAIKVHENYNSATIRNDIGGFMVNKDIQYTNDIGPIPLASQNPEDGQKTYVTGWGYDSYPNTHVPEHLQELNQNIIAFATCKAALKGRVGPASSMKEGDQLCALSDGKKGHGACKGDSGGPLVILGTKGGNETVQIGIVSFGIPCALGFPDVYTSVANFLAWILKNLKE